MAECLAEMMTLQKDLSIDAAVQLQEARKR